MSLTSSEQNAFRDGPYLHWKQPHAISFTYLMEDSVEVKEVKVSQEDYLELQGQLWDQGRVYPVASDPKPAPAVQSGVEKIMILGDMHGMYAKLLAFLQQHKVVDEEGRWSWGKGQLVFCGDLLDRGTEVTELLWFVYRLEKQAEAAGGGVHYLLGNHELMVMEGDERYVARKYRELFSRHGLDYAEMFNEKSVLGRWIRSRNTIICLNELLICHAGLSPQLASAGLSIEEINRLMREGLQYTKEETAHQELLMGSLGPLWYRGYFFSMYEHARILEEEVERVLQEYEASHTVIAHTTVNQVKPLFDRKVFAVDLDVNSEMQPLEALLFREGKFFRLGAKGKAIEI